MNEPDGNELQDFLHGARLQLGQAPQVYGRALSPTEYWWLGVGLAATTLAELDGQTFVAGRVEQLIDRLGHKGVKGDWLQRFVEELANLNAEGLLWPVYQRNANGAVEPTGLTLHPAFDGEAAYFLALGHIGVALAVHNGEDERVSQLAGAIGELVESGRSPAVEVMILGALRVPEGDR